MGNLANLANAKDPKCSEQPKTVSLGIGSETGSFYCVVDDNTLFGAGIGMEIYKNLLTKYAKELENVNYHLYVNWVDFLGEEYTGVYFSSKFGVSADALPKVKDERLKYDFNLYASINTGYMFKNGLFFEIGYGVKDFELGVGVRRVLY